MVQGQLAPTVCETQSCPIAGHKIDRRLVIETGLGKKTEPLSQKLPEQKELEV
jgi:hypothetical protein